MTTPPIDPAFKKAAIDWLLSVGTSEGMGHSTSSALAMFAVRGVDYQASEMPDFRSVAIEPGDTDNSAVFATAVAAEIVPVNREDWRDSYTFHIDDDSYQRLLLGHVIRGVVSAGEHDWKSRVDERSLARARERYGHRPEAKANVDAGTSAESS